MEIRCRMPTHIRGETRDANFKSLADKPTREAAIKTLQELKAQLTNGTGVKGGRLRINAKGDKFKRARWWQLFKRSNGDNHQKTYKTLVGLLKNAGLDETKHTKNGVLQDFQNYFGGPKGKKHVGTKQALKTINAALELVHLDSPKGNQQDVLVALGKKNEGQSLGKGSFGEVFKFELNSTIEPKGDDRDCVLKTFFYKPDNDGWMAPKKLVSHPPSTVNSTRFAKGGSSRLTQINHGELLSSKLAKSPITGMTYNQYYVIEEKNSDPQNKFHSVRARALKLFIRTRPLNSEICLRHVIQREAKGIEVESLLAQPAEEQVDNEKRTEIQHQILKSGLDTLVEMAEKGYVHRDIKPANMKFDEDSRAVTFLDPGGLLKFTNQNEDELQKDVNLFGSRGYMHPAVDDRSKMAQVGVKSDVYAFAMTVLHTVIPRNDQSRDLGKPESTMKRLDELMAKRPATSPSVTQAIRSLCELALEPTGGRTKSERETVVAELVRIRSSLMESKFYTKMANELRSQAQQQLRERTNNNLVGFGIGGVDVS